MTSNAEQVENRQPPLPHEQRRALLRQLRDGLAWLVAHADRLRLTVLIDLHSYVRALDETLVAPVLNLDAERMPADLRAFGRRLRVVRESLGLTRIRLAAAAGIAESTVKNLEFGRNAPRRFVVGAVLRALRQIDPAAADVLLDENPTSPGKQATSRLGDQQTSRPADRKPSRRLGASELQAAEARRLGLAEPDPPTQRSLLPRR